MKKHLALGAIALFSIVTACGKTETKETAKAKDKSYPTAWNYESDWQNIAMDCVEGTAQSPINITVDSAVATNKVLSLGYNRLSSANIQDKKYAVDIIPTEELTISYGDTNYKLLQFHFHSDSEHTINEHQYPLENHFVHQSEDGSLAVLGVFFKEGEHNPEFQKILDAVPSNEEQTGLLNAEIDVTALMPANKSFFSYTGSLTTPGCNEIVNWIVFEEPVDVSAEQIQQFLSIREGQKNNRAVQPLNNRTVNFTAN